MSRKLLLADDSVTIQRVIELTFADEDVEVTTVGDGQLAIDRLELAPAITGQARSGRVRGKAEKITSPAVALSLVSTGMVMGLSLVGGLLFVKRARA